MKKKLTAVILAALLAVSCAACGSGGGGREDNSSFSPDLSSASGLSLAVDQQSGQMIISRPTLEKQKPMGPADTWTIFVYLCGTDLESKGGYASSDIMEMLAANASDNVRFVVETGGANHWYYYDVNSKENQRFVVENGRLIEVDSVSRSAMGQSSTLADFLRWGVANYPAAHMGVILWDHGGGSISGVCFDQRDHFNSLSLREMDTAFLSAFETMTDTFEFVGFDACLMGTVETANVLASYADYMCASEESIPGSGWNYTAIGNFLAAHPDADGAALGQLVCDSFYSDCKANGYTDSATMSVIDLGRLDNFLVTFNDFARNMYKAGSDEAVFSSMVRGIVQVDNFGGNNSAEGYTNMVDLGGIIAACAPWTDGADETMAAMDDVVIYNIAGSSHYAASGLSIYYPLSIQGSSELSTFGDICVSPYYLAFVDRQGYGSVNGGDISDYSDDHLFQDGVWQWYSNYNYDESTGTYEEEETTDTYWDYIDDFEQTGESPLITFEYEPQLDEEGTYWFVLDDNGYDNAADVYAYVFELSADEEDFIELGETYDVYVDWDTGYVCDYFDGYWLSLPDGQNLATYIVEVAEDHIIYTSPILLNDEEMFLRLRQNEDWSVTIEGVWDGIDSESGAADRDMIKLQEGDVIVPMYYSYTTDDFEEGYYVGWEYVVHGTPEIEYAIMEAGDYLYAFCIDDVFGDYYMTDFIMFNVDDNGDVYFYE